MNKSKVTFKLFLFFSTLVALVFYPKTQVFGASFFIDKKVPISSQLSTNEQNINTSKIIINEVMFYPNDGEFEWVELKNTGSTSISIAGWGLTDEDGNWYCFPDYMPDVPVGAFVLVYFDGLLENFDLDFGDNLVSLHTGPELINTLEDDADQLALYNVCPSHQLNLYSIYLPVIQSVGFGNYLPPIVSFVAWGEDPGMDASSAITAGLWTEESSVDIILNTGLVPESSAISPNKPIGLLPGHNSTYAFDWTIYDSTETTPGKNNPIPAIDWYYPEDGAAIDAATFSISWNSISGANGYQFQIDSNPEFSSPLYDTVLNTSAFIANQTVPNGNYYWRVKTISDSGESQWSTSKQVQSIVYDPSLAPQALGAAQETLGIQWQLQHKDTYMLDLDGSSETGQGLWNSAHEVDGDLIVGNGTPIRANELDNMYCVRASISMLASFYGGKLTQDRISYQIYGIGGPRGDLGFGKGPTASEIAPIVSWALGSDIQRHTGKPSFEQIKTWIDEGRPILSATETHMRLIDGYREWNLGPITVQQIHLLDPWSAPRDKWPVYSTDNMIDYWVGPSGTSGAPNVRSDEDLNSNGISDTLEDSDHDGISNFDEQFRFITEITNPDSDWDGIIEIKEVREYVFDTAGNYRYLNADIDRDGLPKEKDPDNDNDSANDGCEDSNRNGKFESELGETSNFNDTQVKLCSPITVDTVLIPDGTFQMGCDPFNNNGQTCMWWEFLHTIYLDKYEIDKYEVTNTQYRECVIAGACEPPMNIYSWDHSYYFTDPAYSSYPVIFISWSNAQDFCNWAGKRLPSEAEWEKAARGSADTRVFPWGNVTPDCSTANFDIYNDNLIFNNCVGDTSLVGSYSSGASPYGLLDMGGNISEWVNDWYSSDYYYNSPANNPNGPSDGTYKVLRGGSWYDGSSLLRVATRDYADPTLRGFSVGFRCADIP